MEVTLGFVAVLVLVLFPGLIFRRLYFYGEFSKQFNSNQSFISLIAVSSLPGLINLISIFYLYDNYITAIDLGEIIDKFKDVNNPTFRYTNSNDTPIKEIFNDEVIPFLGFLYLTITIIGILAGRFIRITKLDTKFKLLRFKNYWFYLFNGQMSNFKKLKHLKKSKKKHLFTKADILVDTNNKTNLYSGIIVDYELLDNDSRILSKVILQNAERYSFKDEKTVPVSIPGTLFVVDCKSMKNINLTYVYEETKELLKSKLPSIVENIQGVIFLILIPIFIFRAESIKANIYEFYFQLNWFLKIIAFLFTAQLFGVFNPFLKNKDNEYRYVTLKIFFSKILFLIILALIIWLFN